jgi:hypothetical protein
VGKNKIIKIEPNAVTWKGKKRNEFVTEFRTHNKFSKRIYYAFLPLWKLLHAWDMFWIPNFNFGFDTLTKYPDANPETTTVDGYVRRNNGGTETLATIRAGAGTDHNDAYNGDSPPEMTTSSTTNQWLQISRMIWLFLTSSLTDSADITDAVFSLCAYTKENQLGGSPELDIVASTPASNTDLVNSDYGQLGTTVFASISYASYNGSAYNDFTLDANGIANISKTDVSKFGGRVNWDTDNSFGGSWISLGQVRFNNYCADQTGTDSDPKLVVTYILPNFFAFI